METTDFYCDFVLNNKLEVKKEKETDTILAFHHTKPNWSFHVVIIPKQHVRRLVELEDTSIIAQIFSTAKEVIRKYNLHETNYKIITNGGSFQDSQHLHFHLVSGEPFTDFAE